VPPPEFIIHGPAVPGEMEDVPAAVMANGEAHGEDGALVEGHGDDAAFLLVDDSTASPPLCADAVCQPKTKVTFKLARPSQDVRCTTDGTDPTDESLDCTNGIEVQQSGTVVKAMALGAQGTSPSAVVSSPAVDVQCYQPRIKLVSADAPVEMMIEPSQWDSTVYYTTDGTKPGLHSKIYTRGEPIRVTRSPTILSAVEQSKACNMSPVEMRWIFPDGH